MKAGVGVVDATWHVGASAGQYASSRAGLEDFDTDHPEAYRPRPEDLVASEFDPQLQSTKRTPSYGVQSRLSIRAIVVEGGDGTRIALVKNDNYLAQDTLLRRVGQLLAERGSKIDADHVLMTAAHNHSAPYYASPSWGVWLFQDVMDLRMFEYQARAMATAIIDAEKHLVPARMGATTVQYSATQRNAPGPAVADDGTPTGYPSEYNDHGLVVMRFDDLTDPRHPKPLATWMNFGQHPESLDGYDLISGDYLAPLQRFVDRETGAPVVFSQGSVGSAEQPGNGNTERLPDGTIRAFSHAGYAQAERGARLMANAVLSGWREIGAGGGTVPYSSNFPVKVVSQWFPGPLSHPYPSVSNCRSESTVEGNPGAPVIGLPDCERPGDADPNNQLWESLKATGAPLPEHYDAPAFGAVEENDRLHLQAFRLGEVLLASCACEPQVDLILNFESRADDRTGNIVDGFDWGEFCDKQADGSYRCANPQKNDPADRSLVVSADRFARMQAQVHNDAKGWDDPSNAATAGSEPADPKAIKGNFTKEELDPAHGYKLPVGVGHAGDYNGYTVSYRMYMSFDHYRKALTSYGPHTADYMVTRMVRLAGSLKGAPAPAPEVHDATAQADEARAVAQSTAIGQASSFLYDTYAASLPDDAGEPAAVRQPKDVRRFDAATFTWRGGDNYVDNPVVRVERKRGNKWVPYADQTGEVQTVAHLPTGVQSEVATRTGTQEWTWTANFEAFDFFPRTIDPRGPQVPDGEYRFVVDGTRRTGGADKAYHLESSTFRVDRWEGIQVTDLRAAPDGSVSFVVPPIVYPRTYKSQIRFVGDDKRTNTPLCFTCAFRPWASTGEVARATVTVVRAGGGVDRVPATLSGGRWVASTALASGDRAFVDAGGVVDTYGEVNGAATPAVLAGGGTAPAPVLASASTTGGASATSAGGDGLFDLARAVRPIEAAAAGALLLAVLALIPVVRRRVTR